MIPLHDDNPTQRFPWLTVLVIAVNAIVFAMEASMETQELNSFLLKWAFIPQRFFESPLSVDQLKTLVVSMFLHGGWLHLIGNMLFLWIFGNNIEDRLGALRFGLFYLVCGATAALAQAFAAPEASIPMVGASGAIAGVLGAYLMLYPRARVVTVIPIFFYIEVAALPAAFVIGFWFLLQLAQGVGSLGALGTEGGVAWWAHVGGFVAGIIAILPAVVADGRARRRATRF
ncbi:MAG: rhomboid family intramembrane serine protease [Coriobacteriia bacterium]